MNLWEQVELTGKDAGVLRADDSNDRAPAGMATREAVKVPIYQRSIKVTRRRDLCAMDSGQPQALVLRLYQKSDTRQSRRHAQSKATWMTRDRTVGVKISAFPADGRGGQTVNKLSLSSPSPSSDPRGSVWTLPDAGMSPIRQCLSAFAFLALPSTTPTRTSRSISNALRTLGWLWKSKKVPTSIRIESTATVTVDVPARLRHSN